MQAIILAAGRGIRLDKLTTEYPKCLLEVGGRPLMAYSLNSLAKAGLSEGIIVTGHYDQLIRRSIGDRHNGMPVRYVFNAAYVHTGSVISLLVGAKAIAPGPVLVLESDLLYHPAFIDVALAMADDQLLVADMSGSGDEVYICARPDGRLEYLGKAAPAPFKERSLGEFAGISRLSGEFLASYCAVAQVMLECNQADGHYEELIFQLAREGAGFKAKHCPGLIWTEVDTVADLKRAREDVYPRLRDTLLGLLPVQGGG